MATTEERLAALEAKMAQLTATTPTTYYTHQYSGEEIDNAVGRALTNGAIDQSVGTFVRPNLLDNWYFGNPVNQRGQTEYARDGYTVDRWALVSTGAGSFLLHGSDNYSADVKGTFYQQSENERFIVGAKYTLSVLRGMITSPTLYHDTFDLTASNGWKSRFNVNGGTFGFYYGKNTSDIQFDLDDTKTLIAVKLELGSTQTLAHREGDKWILNEVPDYGEQLRRCQRYFQTFATESLRPTNALDFRPVMRATPALSTITVGGKTLYTASADL